MNNVGCCQLSVVSFQYKQLLADVRKHAGKFQVSARFLPPASIIECSTDFVLGEGGVRATSQ
jgi:hypothetical protein